jgi:putative FmdB family regulatory protein
MPLYEYSCGRGHRFEKLVPFADSDSPTLACPACGATGCRRLPSSAALLGRAGPPPGRDAAPRSWEETNGGDRDTILHWQRTLEKRRKLEDKYPELAGDTRPVLAHEGPYAEHPLRADP